MSFGNLNKILERTKKILDLSYTNNMNVSLGNLSIMKEQILKDLRKDFAEVTPSVVDEVFNKLFKSSYEYNSNSINSMFKDGKNSFREIRELYPDVVVPPEYKQLSDHFDKLLNTPQPAQRTPEWYAYRNNRITASDTATAVDLNPYEPIEGLIKKKSEPNPEFRDNVAVCHGKKFEQVATSIYEHMVYNIKDFEKDTCEVTEFGCMEASKPIYKILGASPDGICSRYTLDNKFSKRLGTMLEIKCPITREIHNSGKIAGEVCPFYYYCQVQQQLAVCDLDICDFWQCKLTEYQSRQEYLVDQCNDTIHTVGTYEADPKIYFGNNISKAVNIKMDPKLKKGCILEFYPKKFTPEFDGDMIEWKSKYIYAKRMDMDESQYDQWVMKILNEYKESYPSIYSDYHFNKIIYWKLEFSHNLSIKRDDKFMVSLLPVLHQTWKQIKYYRDNQDKLPELETIIEQRKKYFKINTSYTIYNEQIVKNKYLFLNSNFDKSVLVKKKPYNPAYSKYKASFVKKPVEKVPDYESDGIDFIDDPPETRKILQDKKKPVEQVPNESDDIDFIDDPPEPKKKLQNKKKLAEKVPDYESDDIDDPPETKKTVKDKKKLAEKVPDIDIPKGTKKTQQNKNK